jgi:hypothetical protein
MARPLECHSPRLADKKAVVPFVDAQYPAALRTVSRCSLDVQSGKVPSLNVVCRPFSTLPTHTGTHPDGFAVSKAMGRASTATAVVIVDYKLTHW